MRKKPDLVSSSLPRDIIEEILQRVSSVKSLLRFKCLSKSCYNFISTAKFAKTHLQKYGKLAHDNAILIEVFRFVVYHCPMDVLFSSKRIDDGVSNFKLDYPFTSDDSIRLVGCSNGLCCILVSRKVSVLFNPFTRKTFTVPPPYDDYDDESYGNEIRGFGYDESNDDYKVLVKSLKRDFFRLYSLKTNSWKTLDNFIGDSGRVMKDFRDYNPFEFEATGVLLKGKLHWSLRSGDISLKIVSFDLGSEAVGVVEPPGCLNGFGQCNPPYPLYVSHEGDVLAVQELTQFFYNPYINYPRPLIKKKNSWHAIDLCFQSLVSPFPPISNEAEPYSTAE